MMQKEEMEQEEQQGRVAPNMGAGGSHPQATSDPREEEAEERRKGTRRPRWADCEDDEGKEEEEQETEKERQQETREKKEQEKEKETRPETGHKELTSEKPPGLEQWVKSEHEKEDEEQRRAQEALEQRKAQEEQEREAKALEERKKEVRAQEERERLARKAKAQEEREKEVKAQEERERQVREARAQEGQEWQVRETEALDEQGVQERKTDAQERQESRVKAQEGCTKKKKKEQREKRALKKKEKKRILCKKITTCRKDTWRGGKSLGGSVSTLDRTYGRREAVDERGVQPPEPCERCALLKKPIVNLERQKEKDWTSGEEKKPTRCTSSYIYFQTQLQQQQQSSNSNSSISSSGKRFQRLAVCDAVNASFCSCTTAEEAADDKLIDGFTDDDLTEMSEVAKKSMVEPSAIVCLSLHSTARMT